MSEFNNVLERQRKHLGLSLGQASKEIGCTKTHLHDLEKGKSSNPRASILNGIVKAYGLTPEFVLSIYDNDFEG